MNEDLLTSNDKQPRSARRIATLAMTAATTVTFALAVVLVPSASATDWAPTGPVSDQPRLPRPVLAGGPSAASAQTGSGQAGSGPRVQTTPTTDGRVTCTSVEGFSPTITGPLYRLVDPSPLSRQPTMGEVARVGSGWGLGTVIWGGGAGDGVVYALNWFGELRWYRYVQGRGWATGSGSVVGRGFVPGLRVANIAVGAGGDLYVVRMNGDLILYRHTGFATGAATWAVAAGVKLGSGWSGDSLIVPGGNRTLYRQYKGTLSWYRHSDPGNGPVTWTPRRTLGTGWNFIDLAAAGAGVLYATDGNTGDLIVYKHADPYGGSRSWSDARGVYKLTLRLDSYGTTIDPTSCSSVV